MDYPFQQSEEQGYLYRTFSSNVDSHELVWHKDKKDREVLIIESNGWKFQMDNQIPVELKEGDVVFIPKDTYHRVIKGLDNLQVRIQEF
jgi:quercetin dioxygenase-like cupin family protein